MTTGRRLMDVPAVAALLDLSAYQVREEHRRGLLPGRRVGKLLRFTEADLDTYVDRIREDKAAAEKSGVTPGSLRRRRA